ncbi:MAG TPA: DUF5344 family protein [Bacillaceae bacterium]
MSTEMEVRHAEVHVSKTSHTLDPSSPKGICERNVLEVVIRLNEMNNIMKLILMAYKSLSQKKEEISPLAVQMANKTHEQSLAASGIRSENS